MEKFILENLQELQILGYLSQNNQIDLKIAKIWQKALSDLALKDLRGVFQHIVKNGLPTDEKGNKTYTLTPAVLRQIHNDLQPKYKPFKALDKAVESIINSSIVEHLKTRESPFIHILSNERDNERAYFGLKGLYELFKDDLAIQTIDGIYKPNIDRLRQKSYQLGSQTTAEFLEQTKHYWHEAETVSYLTVNQPTGKETASV
jgi:hypothetical protein